MATDEQLQEAREELLHAEPNQVRVSKLPDGAMQITILTITESAAPTETPQKGKWAKVAEKFSQENLLRDGLGDELRKSAREFRESLVLKSPFDPTE